MFYNTLQNAIINGGFNFWQRGTNFPAIANSVYFSDRWKNFKTGSAVHTMGRSVDVPPGSVSPYSGMVTVTTAQPSMGVNDFTRILTTIEGNFASRLYGKNVVCSFWVKSSKTGAYSSSFSNNGYTKRIVKDFTVNAANTWEKKIVRFNIETTGTWLKDTGFGLELGFYLAAGANFRTAPTDIWTSVGGSSVNQVNLNDTVNATFQIADVVLVEDNTEQTRVPNFVMAGRDYSGELALCQRYYEKSYDLDVAPSSANYITNQAISQPVAPGAWDGYDIITYKYNTLKRVPAVINTLSPANSLNGIQYTLAGSGPFNGTHGGITFASEKHFNMSGNFAGTGSSATVAEIRFHFTADADF